MPMDGPLGIVHGHYVSGHAHYGHAHGRALKVVPAHDGPKARPWALCVSRICQTRDLHYLCNYLLYFSVF